MLTNEIQARIKARRVACNLTPEQAAEKAEISAIYWRHIETGIRTNPSLDVLGKMAAALGCQMSDFFICDQPAARKPGDAA